MNHYLVAMDFSSKKLTIDGTKYFSHLPELVKVSPVLMHGGLAVTKRGTVLHERIII